MASNTMNTMVVLLVLALEGSYYDSVRQGLCTGGKEIVLCQNKGERVCQFYGRPFEEDDEESTV